MLMNSMLIDTMSIDCMLITPCQLTSVQLTPVNWRDGKEIHIKSFHVSCKSNVWDGHSDMIGTNGTHTITF